MQKRIFIYITVLLLVPALLILSCNKDRLDVEPSFVTEDAYFTNETEFNRQTLGIYAKLSDFYWYNGGQGNTTMPLFLLMGDDLTITDQDEFEQFGQLQASSGRVSYFYRTNYQLIARANVVLEKIATVADGVFTTAGFKDQLQGEAYFLRGLGYFNLANYFGTSPIRLSRPTSTDSLAPPSSSGTQLIDQAVSDFSAAAGLLPESYDANNRGRATMNSANGMLGKALVFRGNFTGSASDYTNAIAAFDKITGVSLEPDFGDNFAFDTENNSESLFEFQASSPFAFDNVWLDNDFDNPIGSMSAFWGFYDNNFALFGKSRFYATDKLANAFEAGDPRKELTLDPATGFVRKYVLRDKITGSGVSSANNVRILRYADVLLLKAEAILLSGGSKSEAIELINQVRKRARDMSGATGPADYSTSETNQTTIMGWIINERLLELAAEGQRWIDLRRWQLAGLINLDNNFFNSKTNTMAFDASKHLLLPIPTSELDANQNVSQNPGY